MTLNRLPSLFLAAALPFAPLARVAPRLAVIVVTPMVHLLRWAGASAALLGPFHSVSGASAAISGLSPYDGGMSVGTPTNNAVARVGDAFDWRITVRNPGSDHLLDFFDCEPLPPGLTISRDLGGNGHIVGSPTAEGVFPVVLIAGNVNYATPLQLEATITILAPAEAPVIGVPPRNRSVLVGDSVIFTVTATGTEPFKYQWLFNGQPMPGATSATLELVGVKTSDAGDYRVVVSNGAGEAKSTPARLSVQEPLIVRLQLRVPEINGGVVTVPITGPIHTNYVLWVSDDLRTWRPAGTNAVVDGWWLFEESGQSNDPARFYRAEVVP